MKPEGYILVDGNNLAHKALHAYDAKTSEGRDVNVIFGFLEQFISMRKTYSGHIPLIVWDGGYRERTRASEKAVADGIIPSAYKANRHGDEADPLLESLYDQIPDLQRLLGMTDIPQIMKAGYEADDVISSYCRQLSGRGMTILCYTADHDYYQLISPDVFVVSRLAGVEDIYALDDFRCKYGIEPAQWVDIGALMGDKGDNIHGVPGVGIKHATVIIKDHGTAEKAVKSCCGQLEPQRAEFPDLHTPEGIGRLQAMNTKATSPYAGCYPGMPYTGVALAYESGKIHKLKRIPMLVAMYQERVRLAKFLKKMKDDLEVPPLRLFDRMEDSQFEGACERYELGHLRSQARFFKNTGDIREA